VPDGMRWVLAALAAFRLTWSAVNDDGPGETLYRLRLWAGCFDRDAAGQPARPLGRFLECAYCVGMVLALPPALLALYPSAAGDLLLAWLGIAGAVALFIRWRPWR
jgi:hypothetical protein